MLRCFFLLSCGADAALQQESRQTRSLPAFSEGLALCPYIRIPSGKLFFRIRQQPPEDRIIEALLLLIEPVAPLTVHPQLRPGDGGDDLPGGIAAQGLILFAADHEGSGADPAESIEGIVGQAGLRLSKESVIGCGLRELAKNRRRPQISAAIDPFWTNP